MPADALTQVLATTATAPGPRLTWYGPGERIELTGHVLGMWMAKTAGLVTAEADGGQGPDGLPHVHLALPVHWRTVTWAAGSWLAGACVRLTAPPEAGDCDGADGSEWVGVALGPDRPRVLTEPPGLCVASAQALLDGEAGAQVLVPLPSLALRWPGGLPPLVLDGAADLMTYPDTFPTPPQVTGSAPALVLVAREDGHARTGGPRGTQVLHGPGTRGARVAAVLSRDALVENLPDRSGCDTPLLVRADDAATVVRLVLAAWSVHRAAVLLSPGLEEADVAAAARQEGAAPR